MHLLRVVIKVTQFDEPNSSPEPSELSVHLEISASDALAKSVSDNAAEQFEEALSDQVEGFKWVQDATTSYAGKPTLKICIGHVGLSDVKLANAAELQRFGKSITKRVRDIVAGL